MHARKSRQRKKLQVQSLRNGIEDLQVRHVICWTTHGSTRHGPPSTRARQAEIDHLTPLFQQHVAKDLEAWKAHMGFAPCTVSGVRCLRHYLTG